MFMSAEVTCPILTYRHADHMATLETPFIDLDFKKHLKVIFVSV